MKRLAVLLALAALPVGALDAKSDPAGAAREAASALEDAFRAIAEAEGARNRIRALTETVRAFEDGLAALRDGLRAATLREADLRARLDAEDAEIGQLLGVLSSLGPDLSPQTVMHPLGPVGSLRAGMLVSAVTPALAEASERLREDYEEMAALRAVQRDAMAQLEQGLVGVQQARATLSDAIAARRDLPRRFTEDPVQTALLIAATETLDAFAGGLGRIAVDEAPGALPEIGTRKGALPLPVRGTILRRAGEADAAGVTRPGIVVETAPRALVTTPTAATVRYTGPLLDYGLVMILEPQTDLLLVLAGMGAVYGETGQVLPAGSPVGLMGGEPADADGFLSPSGDGGGARLAETLYIEMRTGDEPVDPLTWFAPDKR